MDETLWTVRKDTWKSLACVREWHLDWMIHKMATLTFVVLSSYGTFVYCFLICSHFVVIWVTVVIVECLCSCLASYWRRCVCLWLSLWELYADTVGDVCLSHFGCLSLHVGFTCVCFASPFDCVCLWTRCFFLFTLFSDLRCLCGHSVSLHLKYLL